VRRTEPLTARTVLKESREEGMGAGRANAGYAHVTTTSQPPLVSMATALSSPLSDPGGRLICQRLALAVVLVDLGNTSKEIIRCFSITARFAGSHRSLQPNTARLPVQSVPVPIRQRLLPTKANRARHTLALNGLKAGIPRAKLVALVAKHVIGGALGGWPARTPLEQYEGMLYCPQWRTP